MRTIKFRAYDWKKKKMVPVFYLDWTITTFTPNLKKINNRKLSDFKLMQFTGLKDKNEKEIYESDIVQVEGAIPAEIYWLYSAWQLRNGDKTGGMLGNWEPEQIEVIGNIYENPELLKLDKL